MVAELTFAQLARLCAGIARDGAAAHTRRDVQVIMRLGAVAADDALIEARDRGYLDEGESGWRLTTRGQKLASAVAEAAQEFDVSADRLSIRPFTAWFPSGEEDLG